MTVTREVTVWCDNGGPMACGEWRQGSWGLADLRKELKRGGWKRTATGDLCPRCAAEPTDSSNERSS